MPWSVLILPLLGGYWFLLLNYRSRFNALQLSRERLLLEGATYGLLFLAFSRLVCVGTANVFPGVASAFHQYFPEPYSGTFTGAFILGPILALTLNLSGQAIFFPRPSYSTRTLIRLVAPPNRYSFRFSVVRGWLLTIRYCRKALEENLPGRLILSLLANTVPNRHMANVDAIAKFGDQLEKMLLTAHLREQLTMFSLHTGKVYVAWLIETPANLDGRSKYFVILPYLSGYRDAEKGTVSYTTDYYSLLQSGVPWDELTKLLTVDDIAYVNRFSEEHREKFEEDKGE